MEGMFRCLAALGLALSLAGGAAAAALALVETPPLHPDELASISATAEAELNAAPPEPAIAFQEVPEPSTLLLLSMGLAGLSLFGREQAR